MALNAPNASGLNAAPASIRGYGTGEVPEAVSEIIFRRSADETVLWRGQPDFRKFASSAFRTNIVAVYFAILTVGAYFASGMPSAITVAVMGAVAFLILLGLAWLSVKKTSYILTSQRVVMVIGIALEKRISIPLKHIGAADLKPHGKAGHGSIALQITGDQPLGYMLLWPHCRPLHFASPQPLLRALPDAEGVARMLADACAQVHAIERNMAGDDTSTIVGATPPAPNSAAPDPAAREPANGAHPQGAPA